MSTTYISNTKKGIMLHIFSSDGKCIELCVKYNTSVGRICYMLRNNHNVPDPFSICNMLGHKVPNTTRIRGYMQLKYIA